MPPPHIILHIRVLETRLKRALKCILSEEVQRIASDLRYRLTMNNHFPRVNKQGARDLLAAPAPAEHCRERKKPYEEKNWNRKKRLRDLESTELLKATRPADCMFNTPNTSWTRTIRDKATRIIWHELIPSCGNQNYTSDHRDRIGDIAHPIGFQKTRHSARKHYRFTHARRLLAHIRVESIWSGSIDWSIDPRRCVFLEFEARMWVWGYIFLRNQARLQIAWRTIGLNWIYDQLCT